MFHSIKIGLFIGITIASAVLFILKTNLITNSYYLLVFILYMYVFVGFLTAFFVHKTIKKHRLKEE